MKSYWVSVAYDAEIVLNNCFVAESRDAAVAAMMNYLHLEFDLPKQTELQVQHH